MAMYEALIQRNLKVANYQNLQNSYCRGFYEFAPCRHLTPKSSGRHLSVVSYQWQSLSNTKKLHAPDWQRPKQAGWVASLENTLNTSKTEQVCYDFKMGFAQITGAEKSFSPKIVSKIVKTLTAMTNTKPGECIVIVGVVKMKLTRQHMPLTMAKKQSDIGVLYYRY